jgi:hypothetical protein
MQQVRGLPDDLSRRIAVQPAGALIPPDDSALRVDRDDRILGRRIEQVADDLDGFLGACEGPGIEQVRAHV